MKKLASILLSLLLVITIILPIFLFVIYKQRLLRQKTATLAYTVTIIFIAFTNRMMVPE